GGGSAYVPDTHHRFNMSDTKAPVKRRDPDDDDDMEAEEDESQAAKKSRKKEDDGDYAPFTDEEWMFPPEILDQKLLDDNGQIIKSQTLPGVLKTMMDE